MSNTGQAVLTIVGTAVGAMVGAPQLGFLIGSAAGQALFPTQLPATEGPRLHDLRVQTASFGSPIPLVFGTVRIAGRLIWSSGLIETAHEEEEGGKGGPVQQTTTYTYSASFAIGLNEVLEGGTTAVRRIWADGKLIYDISPQAVGEDDNSYTARGAANSALEALMTVYPGTVTQDPDPTIESYVGVGNTPAYRGQAYVVFAGLQLADYGNRIPNLEFEVVSNTPDSTGYATLSNGFLTDWYGCESDEPRKIFSRAVQGGPSAIDSDHYAWGLTNDFSYTLNYPVGININTTGPDADPEILFNVWRNASGFSRLYDVGWRTFADTYPYTTNKVGCPSPGEATKVVMHYNVLYPGTWMPEYSKPRLDGRWWRGGSGSIGHHATQAALAGMPAESYFWFNGLGGTGGIAYYGATDVSLNFLYPPIDGGARGQNTGTFGFEFRVDQCSVDGQLIVTRSPGVPTDPPHQELPENPEFGVTDDGTVFKRGTFVLTAGSYKCLQKYTEAGGVVTKYPLNPVIESGSANDTQAFWEAQYASAVADGAIAGGLTYGVDYPTALTSTYVKTYSFLSVDRSTTTLRHIVEQICYRCWLEPSDIDATDLDQVVFGYIVPRPMTGRAAIEALVPAFFFDGVETDGLIRFQKRGRNPVATITEDELGAVEYGSEPAAPLEIVRAQDMELPRRIRVGFLDYSRDYQLGSEYAARLITQAENTVDVELPIVLTTTLAVRAADALLYEAWIGRKSFSASLGREYLFLDPGDVITVTVDDAEHQIRLTEVTYDGRVVVRGVADDATSYVSDSTGGNTGGGQIVGGLKGPTILQLLDIPALQEAGDNPGYAFGVYGPLDGWTGAAIQRSTDGGATFASIAAKSLEMTLGEAVDALPTAVHTITDYGNTLTLRMTNGSLSSINETAFKNYGNLAAIGAPGRWEIIQFKNATLNADGTYTLDTFLRGLFGTEWAKDQHEAGDTFVLLNVAIGRTNGSMAALNIPTRMRAVTFGTPTTGATIQDFTPVGVALECFAPTNIKGSRDASGNLTINWRRRTRFGGDWNDYADVALNEESESYEIDVMNGAAVVRTITATTNEASYTAAQQTTDFGSAQNSITLNIYQLSASVGRGYVGEATI